MTKLRFVGAELEILEILTPTSASWTKPSQIYHDRAPPAILQRKETFVQKAIKKELWRKMGGQRL